MAEKPTLDTGAWASDEAALKAVWLTGKGSDTDLPDSLRFLSEVRRLLQTREREPDCEFNRSAAFVLVPAAFFESPPSGLVRRPFLNTGNYRLTGQTHYLNVAASGRSRDYNGDDGDLIDTLTADKADTFPTVIYVPKTGGYSKLSWYPAGTGNATNVHHFPVAFEEPTAELISLAIEGVYQGELKTPDQVPAEACVWKKADKGWAVENAEELVQRAVKIGLHGRFPHCRIVAEQPGKDGRTDIEVVGDFGVAPGAVTNFAVLEMKVLRERGSTGILRSPKDIEAHVVDGLNQAHTYGDDRNFRNRMLCSFDMRATNAGATAVFAAIHDSAKTLGVHLCYWFMYRSSEHYRQCKVAAKLTAG